MELARPVNKERDKSSGGGIEDHEYAEHAQTFHLASLAVVDLEWRPDFERRLGDLLKK